MIKFLKSNWVLLLILVIATFFRFWHIKTFPNGLFPDEAANGLDINSIFRGDLHPFYPRGNGREALFFYLLAISVSIFGRGPWQHHIVTGMVGMAEIIVTYLLVKRMFGPPRVDSSGASGTRVEAGKRTALLASFFMATSSYAVMLNHNAFRANLIPLFTASTFLFIIKFFQTPETNRNSRLMSAFWAGISFGLGFYTYISYRMMIPLIFGMGALIFLAYRKDARAIIKKYTKPKLVFAAGFLIAFAWIGAYFVVHPGAFIGRAGQVSIFNKELNHGDVVGTFIDVVKKTLMSFFTNGDNNWRQNVAGFPFLSPFISPFFAIALILFTLTALKFLVDVWRQKIDEQSIYKTLLAAWFWFMIVPEISTAEGIPHGLRIIGVIPPIFILSAWAVNKFWEILKRIFTGHQSRFAFAASFIALILAYNYFLVFQVAAKSPDLYYAYRSDLTDVSNYLIQRHDKAHTFLVLDQFSVQTTDYLTTAADMPYILLDPETSWQRKLKKGDQIIFTQSTIYDSTNFEKHHKDHKLVRMDKSPFGDIIMLVYQQP